MQLYLTGLMDAVEVFPDGAFAGAGYDPAYGARRLQRKIERLLLPPLAGSSESDLTAEGAEGQVVWHPVR